MKNVILILVALLFVTVSSPVYAVITYSDTFSGAAGTPPDVAWYVNSGAPTHNGAGQLTIQSPDHLIRSIGAGDFVMNLELTNTDVSATADASWASSMYYQIDDGANFVTLGVVGATDWIYWRTNSSVGGFLQGFAGADGDDLDFQLDWLEATGTYTVSLSVNDGPMNVINSFSGFGASGAGRYESIYVLPGTEGKPVVDLDFYNMAVPEPATLTLLGLGGLSLVRRKRG